MKKQILGFTLGLALFGTITSASVQSPLLTGWSMYDSSGTTFPFAAGKAETEI